jgi:hypothetical protein
LRDENTLVRDEQLEAGSGDVDGEEGAPNQHKPGGWGSTARAMTSLATISRFWSIDPPSTKDSHTIVSLIQVLGHCRTMPLQQHCVPGSVGAMHPTHPPPPPPLQKLFNPPI